MDEIAGSDVRDECSNFCKSKYCGILVYGNVIMRLSTKIREEYNKPGVAICNSIDDVNHFYVNERS